MPSFTITGTTTTQQTLDTNDTGFVSVLGALATSGTAVDSAGSVQLTVLGAINAFGGFAVDHDGTDIIVDIGSSGYVGSSTSDSINALVTSSALVSNFGVIQSDSDALDLRDTDGSALIRVVNHGEISARSDGLVLQSGTGTTTVINTGTITSQSYGIFNAFSGQAGVTFVDNSGLIQGYTYSYGGDDSIDIIHNTGTMIGSVDLDDGDDIFDNRGGTLIGRVMGEHGDDTYITDDAALAIVELADEGTDEVQSTVNYTLGDFIENLTLLGVADLNGRGNVEDNLINGNVGDNVLRGYEGADTIFAGAGEDLIYGGDGDDSLGGNTDDDRLYGGLGNDTLAGGRGDDNLLGEGGNDNLSGFTGDDKLLGGAGNDSLRGQDGHDTLEGGSGKDTLVGGDGNDLLTGNFNADRFVFGEGWGDDTITDFAATVDAEKIDLSGVAAITGFTDLSNNHMSQVGSDVVISDLAGNTITLSGVTLGDLDANDFIF